MLRVAQLFVRARAAFLIVAALRLLACDGSLDTRLDNRECTEGECLPGYVCTIHNLCVRESSLDGGEPSRARTQTDADAPSGVKGSSVRGDGSVPRDAGLHMRAAGTWARARDAGAQSSGAKDAGAKLDSSTAHVNPDAKSEAPLAPPTSSQPDAARH
jgi:hypothetical protein